MASLNLEVGIDAAGVVKGSKDAFSALVQLTNATRHLMDGLEAMNGANGAMGKFGMLMSRASPYIMAATAAMGAISLAMNVFSGNTDKASTAIDRQASAVDGLIKRFAELDIRRGYGATDPRASSGGTIDTLTALRTSSRDIFTPSDAAGLFGVSEQKFREALGEDALTLNMRRNQFADRFQRAPDGSITGVANNGFAMNSFNREQVVSAGERLLRQRRQQEASSAPTEQILGPGAMYGGMYDGRLGGIGMSGGIPGNLFDQPGAAQEAKRRADQEQLRVMRETEQSARAVGQALGDAATRFVTGMATARELAASIATDLLRTGLTEGFTAGARGIFNSFGKSAAQAGADGIAGNSGT